MMNNPVVTGAAVATAVAAAGTGACAQRVALLSLGMQAKFAA